MKEIVWKYLVNSKIHKLIRDELYSLGMRQDTLVDKIEEELKLHPEQLKKVQVQLEELRDIGMHTKVLSQKID